MPCPALRLCPPPSAGSHLLHPACRHPGTLPAPQLQSAPQPVTSLRLPWAPLRLISQVGTRALALPPLSGRGSPHEWGLQRDGAEAGGADPPARRSLLASAPPPLPAGSLRSASDSSRGLGVPEVPQGWLETVGGRAFGRGFQGRPGLPSLSPRLQATRQAQPSRPRADASGRDAKPLLAAVRGVPARSPTSGPRRCPRSPRRGSVAAGSARAAPRRPSLRPGLPPGPPCPRTASAAAWPAPSCGSARRLEAAGAAPGATISAPRPALPAPPPQWIGLGGRGGEAALPPSAHGARAPAPRPARPAAAGPLSREASTGPDSRRCRRGRLAARSQRMALGRPPPQAGAAGERRAGAGAWPGPVTAGLWVLGPWGAADGPSSAVCAPPLVPLQVGWSAARPGGKQSDLSPLFPRPHSCGSSG